jgi:hypothetical protein
MRLQRPYGGSQVPNAPNAQVPRVPKIKWRYGLKPSQLGSIYIHMGMSENGVYRYTPNYSHLVGIMIINHWV